MGAIQAKAKGNERIAGWFQALPHHLEYFYKGKATRCGWMCQLMDGLEWATEI